MERGLDGFWPEIWQLSKAGLGVEAVAFYLAETHGQHFEPGEVSRYISLLEKILTPSELKSIDVAFDHATLAVLRIFQAEHDIKIHPLNEYAGLAQKLVAGGSDAIEVRERIIEHSKRKVPLVQVESLVDRMELITLNKATFKNAEQQLNLSA